MTPLLKAYLQSLCFGERYEDYTLRKETDLRNQTPMPEDIGLQRMSLDGKIELCGDEGIVIERYRDSIGVWTIGVGVTAAAGAQINPETYTGRITVRHAVDLMESVLPDYEAIIHKIVGPMTIQQHAFDALVSLAYNVGPVIANPRKSPNTIRNIQNGRYREAILPWNKAGGIKSMALVARRQREAHLAETGVYSPHPIPIYDGRGPRNTPRKISTISPTRLKEMMIAPDMNFV